MSLSSTTTLATGQTGFVSDGKTGVIDNATGAFSSLIAGDPFEWREGVALLAAGALAGNWFGYNRGYNDCSNGVAPKRFGLM